MTLLPPACTSPISGRLTLPSRRIFCTWSRSLSSAKEILMTSPGDSRTAVLGPGGFGRGGHGLWQPPHVSAVRIRTAKSQRDSRNVPLRQTVSVPGNGRSSDVCFLSSCIMAACLFYKHVNRQDKCDLHVGL